jgi:hypothetical protein
MSPAAKRFPRLFASLSLKTARFSPVILQSLHPQKEIMEDIRHTFTGSSQSRDCS